MEHDEMISIEAVTLAEAVRKEKNVVLIFTDGFKTPAVIVDYDDVVIVARVRDQEWMIYRHALSTILLGNIGGICHE